MTNLLVSIASSEVDVMPLPGSPLYFSRFSQVYYKLRRFVPWDLRGLSPHIEVVSDLVAHDLHCHLPHFQRYLAIRRLATQTVHDSAPRSRPRFATSPRRRISGNFREQ